MLSKFQCLYATRTPVSHFLIITVNSSGTHMWIIMQIIQPQPHFQQNNWQETMEYQYNIIIYAFYEHKLYTHTNILRIVIWFTQQKFYAHYALLSLSMPHLTSACQFTCHVQLFPNKCFTICNTLFSLVSFIFLLRYKVKYKYSHSLYHYYSYITHILYIHEIFLFTFRKTM